MPSIHKLSTALSILRPDDHENIAKCCAHARAIVHAGRDGAGQYTQLITARAWYDAAVSLIPPDRAVRTHRYQGRRSGWCCVTRPCELPELEFTTPIPSNAQLRTEFFTMAPLLEAAILIVALKCHAVRQ